MMGRWGEKHGVKYIPTTLFECIKAVVHRNADQWVELARTRSQSSFERELENDS